jgi:hypothetical protein
MNSTSSPLAELFEFIMGGVRTRRVRAVRRFRKIINLSLIILRAPYEEGVSRHPSLAASSFALLFLSDLCVALNQ